MPRRSPSPRKRSGGLAYQASPPSIRGRHRRHGQTRPGHAGSRPISCCTNTGIGTPQARWRLTAPVRAVLDHAAQTGSGQLGGTKRVSSIAFRAFSRRSFVSMEMNHCGVLRKISGAFERQECGIGVLQAAPESASCHQHLTPHAGSLRPSLPSSSGPRCPRTGRTCSRKAAVRPDIVGDRPTRPPQMQIIRQPWLGAICTNPEPVPW